MRKAERVHYIDERLQAQYPEPPIPLVHHDTYSLLVAVLLSAQCTDARVNTVTPSLWELAKTPSEMAQQAVSEVQQIIRPCGLSARKAAAIVTLSQQLCEHHAGQVPASLAALEILPGVGHKTAAVVMSQAFGDPQFPVDTHIHRLAQRWGLTDGRSVVQTERDLRQLFARERWNALHLQMIYWGRDFCSAQACDGTVCEICRHCYPRRRRPVVTRKA